MNKFIKFTTAQLSINNHIRNTGSVLINVNHIVSIKSHWAHMENALCEIRTINNASSFIVEGSMYKIMQIIERTGSKVGTVDIDLQLNKSVAQDLKVLD